jgi:AcrR family transcriptional regulator
MPRKPARAPAVDAKPHDRYHHGDLRRALLDAALLLIERDGPDALTLRAAARLAGVSQAAPYRHFNSKEALIAAVAEDGMRTMTDWMREASAAFADSPAARFQALGVTYIRFAHAHPAHFRVMFGPGAADRRQVPSLDAAYAEAFALLHDSIVESQRAGLVKQGDPRELALAAWAMVHGASSLLVGGQASVSGIRKLDPVHVAERMTAVLFVGLGEINAFTAITR